MASLISFKFRYFVKGANMFQHGQIRIAYIPAAMRASASSTYLDLLAAKSKNARLSDQKEYKL